MVTAELKSGEERRGRRGAGPAIAISLALHAVFFLAVGLMVPKPREMWFEPAPPINVILLPAPDDVHPTSAPKSSARAPLAGRTTTRPALPHIHIPQTPSPSAPPSRVAAPSVGVSPGTGRPGTGVAPGPLPYEETEHGVHAFLRALVGCDPQDSPHLTPEERARCAERFAATARSAQPFSGIDPAKRAAYSVQAAADDRKRADREGPPKDVIVGCGSGNSHEFPVAGGSNMGVGCLSDSAIGHMRIP